MAINPLEDKNKNADKSNTNMNILILIIVNFRQKNLMKNYYALLYTSSADAEMKSVDIIPKRHTKKEAGTYKKICNHFVRKEISYGKYEVCLYKSKHKVTILC